MIELRRLNGKAFVLNCDLIRTVEETPDTVITLTNGDKLMVLETVHEVVEKTAEFLTRVQSGVRTKTRD